MKKSFVGLTCFFVALLIILLFIPSRLHVSRTDKILANPVSVSRLLSNQSRLDSLSKYITGQNDHKSSRLCMDHVQIQMVGSAFTTGVLKLAEDCGIVQNNKISLVSTDGKSIDVRWTGECITGENFFDKLFSFIKLSGCKNSIHARLQRFKAFAENEINIYGILVKEEKVKDIHVMVTTTYTKTYPTLSDIYSRVNMLRNYIASQGAQAMNYPMLHIQEIRKHEYELMVGMATNRPLKDSGRVLYKAMMPGNILTVMVTGGASDITKAKNELSNYMQDHQRSSPALPYELLITDRVKEQDSAAWITGIYYPVY